MQSNPIAIIRSQKLIQSIIFTMICDFHKVTRKWPTKLEKGHFVLLTKHQKFFTHHLLCLIPVHVFMREEVAFTSSTKCSRRTSILNGAVTKKKTVKTCWKHCKMVGTQMNWKVEWHWWVYYTSRYLDFFVTASLENQSSLGSDTGYKWWWCTLYN